MKSLNLSISQSLNLSISQSLNLSIVVLFFFFSFNTAKTQQTFNCNAYAITENLIQIQDCEEDYPGPYTVALVIYFVHQSDGSGGTSSGEAANIVNFLNAKFSEHNIFFSLKCVEDINDSFIYGGVGIGDLYSIDAYEDEQAFNLYISSDALGAGAGGGISIIPSKKAIATYNPINGARTIAHEVAHALGLYHTFQASPYFSLSGPGLPEYVDQRDCCNRGDLVCDTPADPNFNGAIFSYGPQIEGCTWVSSVDKLDPAGVPYPSPLLNNIMSYYQYLDQVCIQDWTFTEGQGRRMRYMLANANVLSSLKRDEVLISGGTVLWNQNKYVDTDIRILSGGQLRITDGATIYMAPGKKIIIEGGGVLKVRFSTITVGIEDLNNYCEVSSGSPSFWAGIEIRGQYDDIGSPGIANIYQSTIQFADNAIYLTEEGLEEEEGSFSHGRLSSAHSMYLNNRKSLNLFIDNPFILSSSDLTYPYNFRQCQFILDENFPAFHNFLGHVSLTHIPRAFFKGCSFSVEGQGNARALDAFDSGVVVESFCHPGYPDENCPESAFTETSFSGFREAIRLSQSHGAKVHKVSFVDCDKSIVAYYSNNLELTKNKIIIPAGNQTRAGIDISNSTGYTIAENSFDADGSSSITNRGIRIFDSGVEANFITNNLFSNLRIGIEVLGLNRNPSFRAQGLGLYCNNYNNTGGISSTGPFDIFLNFSTIADPQGSLFRSGGNFFSENPDTPIYGSDYNNFFGAELTYWYQSNGGDPREFPNNVVGVDPVGTGFEPRCSDYLETMLPEKPGDVAEAYVGYLALRQALNTAIDEGNTDAFVTEILDTPAASFNPVKDKLIDISPYLSEAAMRATLSRMDVLSNNQLRLLLQNNPDLLKDASLKNDIEIIFGAGSLASIKEEIPIDALRTERTELEENIIEESKDLFPVINRGIAVMYQDTLSTHGNTIRAALAPKSSLGSAIQYAETFAGEGDFYAYRQAINQVLINYNSIEDIDVLGSFVDILENQLLSGVLFKKMNTEQVNDLISLGEGCTNTLIRQQISNFLWAYFGIELSPVQALQNTENTAIEQTARIDQKRSSTIESLSIYPNPTSIDKVTLQLPTQFYKQKSIEYSIYSFNHVILENKHITLNQGHADLNIQGLKAGIYLLIVQVEGTLLKSKLIIL